MNIKIIIRLLLLIVPLVVPCPAFAMHPLATDDTETQGAGSVEIELSQQAAGSNYSLDSGVSVHVGLAEDIDLGMTLFLESSSSETGDRHFGLAPPVFDLKWRFWEKPASHASLGIRLDYSPKALSSLTSGGHDAGALLVNCWTIGNVAFHFNVGGYARDIGSEETRGTLYTSGAATLLLNHKISAVIEAVYEASPFKNNQNISGMGGFLWQNHPGQVVSLGAGPMWKADGRLGWMVTAGLTFLFPRGSRILNEFRAPRTEKAAKEWASNGF